MISFYVCSESDSSLACFCFHCAQQIIAHGEIFPPVKLMAKFSRIIRELVDPKQINL